VTSGPGAVRLLTAALLSLLGCVLAVGLAGLGRSAPTAPMPPTSPARPAADRTAALAVLRAWDDARADAWQRGRPRALRALYVVGSESGRADAALLTAYVGRGLRVDGLTVQRADVRVASASDDRLVLVVTDRVVGGTAVGEDGRVVLPRDDWSTRTVVLVQRGDRWRVAEVRDQARPWASTDVTSRSANS
jgi:hypothetical protein